MSRVLFLLMILWCSMPCLHAELSDEDAALIAAGNVLGHAELEGVGLKGYFYDLKQTKDRQPTGLHGGTENELLKELHAFFKSGWSRKKLSRYYRSEDAFFAPFIYMPPTYERYVPVAIGLGDSRKPQSEWECKPNAWLIVYRGRVIAPRTGKFRFIGTGDVYLGVRFNGKNVLEAGYRIPLLYNAKNPRACFVSGFNLQEREQFLKSRKGYELVRGIPGCLVWDSELGGLVAGTPFSVKAGQAYNIEIALSESSGGKCGFVLFIEDITRGKDSHARSYDLFRTANVLPDTKAIEKLYKEAGAYTSFSTIIFNEDSPVWRIAPSQKPHKKP